VNSKGGIRAGVDHLTKFKYQRGPGWCFGLDGGLRLGLCLDLVIIRVRLVLIVQKAQGPKL
jgi:hypothetical protein